MYINLVSLHMPFYFKIFCFVLIIHLGVFFHIKFTFFTSVIFTEFNTTIIHNLRQLLATPVKLSIAQGLFDVENMIV